MKSAFDRAMVLIVDHRAVTLLLVILATLLAIVGYVDPGLVRSLFVRQSGDQQSASTAITEEFEPLPDVDPVSLSDSDAVLVVQSSEFFTPDGAKAMRHVVEKLEELDHVQFILWMDRVPMLNIFGLPQPLFPRSEASPERFAATREKAMKHPLVGGQLLSEDGRTMLLLITFDHDYIRSDEQCTSELREAAEAAAREFPTVPLKFQVTGRMPAWITALRSHEANQVKYQVIGYGVILAMAVVLFRGFQAVIIVALAPAVGVFWTMGFLRFFNLQDNPFNDVILPVLVSLVGFTDGVHMMVQLRKLRASGMPEREAARSALKQVGWACMLTSLTTAIGMGSLILSQNNWVQEFGWCSVIGVTTTFFAVVWLIPLICSTWLGRRIHIGHEKSLIDRNLTRISVLIDWVLMWPRFVSITGIVSTLILTGIALTLRPDEKRSNALPEHSEAYQALQHMDQAMGGLEFSNVTVRWSSDVKSDSPEVLQVMMEVDDLLHSEPQIGHPLSIRNLVDALPGNGEPADRMKMLDLMPPQLKRAFFTPETRHAFAAFRVRDLGIATFGPVFQRIETGLQTIHSVHPHFTLMLQGDAVWRWRNLYQIVVDLASSLGSAAVVIFVVLGFCYQSIRIGLIAIIPNVFPLAVTGTWLVLSGYSLEIVSVCSLTICLGIAVDDTIHFLTRFTEARETESDLPTAIRKAFSSVGVAMVMTTVVLVAGFSTVAFSDSRDHFIFAMMGTLTIATALFGDLVILPAMLACYAPRNTEHDRAPE